VRIAHVVIDGNVAGGQIVALRLARAAQAKGHEAVFFSPSDGPFLELVRSEGFAAGVVPVDGVFDARALARLVRAFRGFDVVHTHAHFSLNVLARVAGRLAGARVLSHMHIGNAFRAGRGRRAQIGIDNGTARLCFAIVAVSNATRDEVVRQGYPAGRVVTVPNGIEPRDDVEPAHLADGRVVLEVARLAEVKGQRHLIAALTRLDASVILVGEDLEHGGSYEEVLRREAERLDVADRVVFAGYRSDVPAVLAGCDVFCLPSTAEGMPLVVLEAMAQGKPVIATAVGGTPELVVDGVTGLLVPPGDADALAEALGRVLSDPELAKRMGAAGRQRVERDFAADASAARILALYGA
jgi:glycosyltransferase involved in cell wall biosynthesis